MEKLKSREFVKKTFEKPFDKAQFHGFVKELLKRGFNLTETITGKPGY